ncbi:ArsC/Spx/MgsR family protein [Pseudomaricurvus sp. HS19]|uniref:ArsC/Spx/MgsR family protein n=1 Tax=Pseudomaricurvus sp. HS19 TaxID=2692626 RepID=UPI00136F94E0|nr:ArsC/Spx/MgsR family protein [Pseudomaricurvus sp. HS19]MYM62272.1 arsenate reductase family protein [Pseudomaricurvus sp. HS19]
MSSAPITFYEKSGCLTNKKQKDLLRRAGYELLVENLLRHDWSATELLRFLGPLPVSEWFNPSAPAVKSGVVVPSELDADSAIALLLDEHLLIRRPLLEREGNCMVGFDLEDLQQILQVRLPEEEGTPGEGCSSSHKPCPEVQARAL